MGLLRRPRRALIATAAVLGSITMPSATAAPAGFVTASGGQFVLNGLPYRYGGTNNYYLSYQSHADVDDVLAKAQAMNLSVIRTWGFIDIGSLDGSVPTIDGNKNGFYFQYWDPSTGAPAYNDGPTGLQGLDYAIASAAAHGLRVIVVLTNDWKEFGGMDQYDKWYGLPYHDNFYTDPRTQQAYKNWVNHLLNRVNSITGVTYKNDPTIFAWELANEPRCVGSGTLPTSGTCTQATIVNWVDQMSAYVKSIDPNHMVSVGDEGFYIGSTQGSGWPYNDPSDGVDNNALLRVKNIDFGTYHLYPNYWGQNADWGTQWIKDHIANAAAIGKPTILEEFGWQDTGSRDSVYQTWTQAVRTNGGAGWNFWMLAGNVNGQPYPNYDGFNVYYPSSTATVLANEALAISTGTSPPPSPSPSPSSSPSASPSPSPSSSPSPSPTPSPSSSPVSGGVKVQYKNNDSAPGDNQIKPGLQVVNTGSSSVDLSTVTVRYWFTRDGGSSTLVYNCDWAAIGCGNIRASFGSVNPATPTADTYLQLSFTGGTLAAGGSTGEIQNRVNKSDWSNFDETNDYSYGTNTAFQDWTKVTVYVNGRLVWGTEPSGTSPSPTPSTSPTPSPSPSPTPSPSSSPSPSPSPSPSSSPSSSAGCVASMRVDSSWPGGFTATVTVSNTGGVSTSGWQVGWSWPSGDSLVNAWNAVVSVTGTSVRAVNASYNGVIPAGGSTTFGFQANGTPGTPTFTCTTS